MSKKYLFLEPMPKLAEYNVPQYSPYYFIYTPETPDKPQQQFVLNDTAFHIIKQFDGTKTYDDILTKLSEKYGESINLIENKINPFILQLVSEYGYLLKEQDEPIEHKITIDSFSNIYPTAASIEVTDRCNMKCRHCYGNFEPQNSTDMPLEEIFFILQSLKDIGIHVVEITGGDPSIYPHIEQVLNKANEIDIPSIMFLTNGFYMPESLLNALISIKHKSFVQVDLHSLNEKYFDWFTGSKGRLNTVKNNIDRLVANGIRVRVAAIFTPGNVHEIMEIADWAYNHGALLYAPSIVTTMGRAAEGNEYKNLCFQDEKTMEIFAQSMLDVKKKYPNFILKTQDTPVNCGALSSELSIKSNGDVKLCNMDNGNYFNINMGNASLHSIKDIYDQNSDFVKEVRQTLSPKMNSETCRDCEEQFFCSHCLIRGLLAARKKKDECHWYKTLSPIIQERLSIN